MNRLAENCDHHFVGEGVAVARQKIVSSFPVVFVTNVLKLAPNFVWSLVSFQWDLLMTTIVVFPNFATLHTICDVEIKLLVATMESYPGMPDVDPVVDELVDVYSILDHVVA